jgi:hypothetical protein
MLRKLLILPVTVVDLSRLSSNEYLRPSKDILKKIKQLKVEVRIYTANLTPLAIEQCNSANRTPTASPQLQRKPNKSEPPLANNLVQIIKTFHMRHLALAADVVRLEIHLALGTGTDRFDACD